MRLRSPAEAGAWLSTLKGLGLRSLSLQALHRARLRSGWYRKVLPTGSWEELPEVVLASARPVFAQPERQAIRAHLGEPEAALEAGRRIAGGELLYFSSRWLKRPEDWRTNPLTDFPTGLEHWSELAPFAGPDQGDVKWIWEASRFDWVYQLGRAWAAAETEEEAESFVEVFWQLLESWRSHNPPNCGINWRCGQECAIRLIALVWASGVFGRASASKPERIALLWSIVSALAGRIDRAMAHALSQNNNHGLSESAALYLAGVALPGHPLAGQWCNKGHRHFTSEISRQFEVDGAYAQHSMNYMRIALRDAFVYVSARQLDGDTAPPTVRDRMVAASELLYQVQDEASGQVPNYGANDGANILALSSCDYEDFRPLLQLLSWQLDERRLYPPGPWDEELAWHVAPAALEADTEPRRRRSFGREAGGYYGIRGERSFGMIRCHSFRNRPGDADMLHLDLWLDGVNVLPDRGSYSYNDPDELGLFLRGTAAHNTVTVDGADQMSRGGRFLWLDWTRASCLGFGQNRLGSWGGWHFEGEHYGYGEEDRGVVHRRQVLQGADEWLVIDDLDIRDRKEHDLSLRWLVHAQAPAGFGIDIFGPGETDELSGEEHLPANGVSRTYGELTPHRLVTRTTSSQSSVRWVTAVGASVESTGAALVWQGLTIPLEANGVIV